MAITNTLMVVQEGYPREFVWFVAVRAIIDKVEETVGAKNIGQIPRGRTLNHT